MDLSVVTPGSPHEGVVSLALGILVCAFITFLPMAWFVTWLSVGVMLST